MLDQYADPLASYAAGDTIGNVTSSMVAAQAVEMRPAMAMPLGTVPVAALPTMSVYSIAPTMPTIVVPMITVP